MSEANTPSFTMFSSGLSSLPDGGGDASVEVQAAALKLLEDLCNELPEKKISHRIRNRDPARKSANRKLLLTFREYTPEAGNDARIRLAFLYCAFSEADATTFPNPVPSSADPVDYTLEVLLPKMQAARQVLGVVAKVHVALSSLGGDIMNVFYVLFIADGTPAETPKSNITPLGPEDPQNLHCGRKDIVKTQAKQVERKFFWECLSLFAPQTRAQLGEDVDSIRNVMLLSMPAHKEFSKFKVWLKETRMPDLYEIVKASKIVQKTYLDYVDFRSTDELAPDPKYIRLHGALGNVMHAAGAAEYLRLREQDDGELERQGVLTGDGSSDLTGVFLRRGLGVC